MDARAVISGGDGAGVSRDSSTESFIGDMARIARETVRDRKNRFIDMLFRWMT